MAVIINELEVVLEPAMAPPPAGGTAAVPKPPQLNPHDVVTLMDRDQRTRLRVLAH
ncbi:MAG: hypothetical protein LAQ69_20895 [Acidobacteriia bacterium]|nr:hypothetical protein [Terriglobia bacterium]